MIYSIAAALHNLRELTVNQRSNNLVADGEGNTGHEGRQRKTSSLDEAKIKKLRRLLKTKTETEVLQKTVHLVLFQTVAAKAWLEKAGAGGVKNGYG